MTSSLTITIMAAGEGKRMRSSLPKVLHLFNGLPMLVRILKEVRELNPQKIIIITGKYDALIKDTILKNLESFNNNINSDLLNKIVYVQQTNPKGTGHAILCTLDNYTEEDNVLILNGDMPCIKSATLNDFIENGINSLFVAKLDNPFGYGRIIVNDDNYIKYIREEKDCNEDERACKLTNVGIYYFSAANLKKYIPLIDSNNIQNEYYLTDIVKIMNNVQVLNNKISIYKIDENNNYQIQGVNTPEELKDLEELEKIKIFKLNNKKLLLFDVDGTLTISGEKLKDNIKVILQNLMKKNYDIGIVGGGKLDKILYQLGDDLIINHYFSECGCVYNTTNNENNKLNHIYTKNIRQHPLYFKINILIKEALKFISHVDYTITGNFIDLRNGIIYISLIGMVANTEERNYFIDLDNKFKYRTKLLELLKLKASELNINNSVSIAEGGSVGIAIYPKEYDKIQVLEYLTDKYNEIHYFGDKYDENGNDYLLLNHSDIIGHMVDNPNDTIGVLRTLQTLPEIGSLCTISGEILEKL